MPPKKAAKNNGGVKDKGSKRDKKQKKEIIEIDYADDEHFDEQLAFVYIEFDNKCYVFEEQFQKFMLQLKKEIEHQKFHVISNAPSRLTETDGQPRRGTFEIYFAPNARVKPKLVWTAIDLGPPRRNKFPEEYNDFVAQIKSILDKYNAEMAAKMDPVG